MQQCQHFYDKYQPKLRSTVDICICNIVQVFVWVTLQFFQVIKILTSVIKKLIIAYNIHILHATRPSWQSQSSFQILCDILTRVSQPLSNISQMKERHYYPFFCLCAQWNYFSTLSINPCLEVKVINNYGSTIMQEPQAQLYDAVLECRPPDCLKCSR